MTQPGDGLDEAVEGIGRSAIMAGGQMLEARARRQEADQRAAADDARARAAEDRARAAALRDVDRVPAGRDDVTALAVLRADDRRTAALDPETTEARDVAARSQARPPVEAVQAPAAAAKGRAPRRGRGRGAERGRDR